MTPKLAHPVIELIELELHIEALGDVSDGEAARQRRGELADDSYYVSSTSHPPKICADSEDAMTPKLALLAATLVLAVCVALLLASCNVASVFWRDQEIAAPYRTVATPTPPTPFCLP